MTSTKQPEMLDVLQDVWDGNLLNRYSHWEDFYKAAKKGNANLGTGYDEAWFKANVPTLVGILSRKKQQAIKDAVCLIFDEVNSSVGERAFVQSEIAQQHRHLLNEFITLVMHSVQEGSQQNEGRAYHDPDEDFGYVVRQSARVAYGPDNPHYAKLKRFFPDEDTWVRAVDDGARLHDTEGPNFDGRISAVLGRFARMFYPWSPKKS